MPTHVDDATRRVLQVRADRKVKNVVGRVAALAKIFHRLLPCPLVLVPAIAFDDRPPAHLLMNIKQRLKSALLN
jgi:hypothetical protein